MQETTAEPMQGIEATGAESDETPLMTAQESTILELYDRLEELQLEIALLKAQGVISQDPAETVSEEDVKTAQQELLKAKAVYQVRTNILDSILIANPVIKAVHSGSLAADAEQDLLPLLQQRDALSESLSGIASKYQSARNELTKVESEHIVVARKNVELATTMLGLAEQVNSHQQADVGDPKLRQQLDELEASMKVSRQRWRIMKGTASGTIAGSGVDWARDPKLLEIVLDDDAEDG